MPNNLEQKDLTEERVEELVNDHKKLCEIQSGAEEELKKTLLEESLEQFAEEGDASAQYYLAQIYEKKGKGEEAKKFYRLAAEQGDTDAIRKYEELSKHTT